MSTASASRLLRRALPLAALAAALLVAAALSGGPSGGPPLDPRSTAPGGTKALVDALGELGVAVELEPDRLDGSTQRALMLVDDLSDEERDEVLRWIEDGGVLVGTDPRSPLAPEVVGSAAVGGLGVAPIEPECDLAAVSDVPSVVPGASAVVYGLEEGALGCFPRDDGYWLAATERGAGAVVFLGGPDVLVNAGLDAPGHPELLAGLLVEQDGRVALLRTRLPGEGESGLADLIGRNVRLFGLQLLIAVLLVVAWRARRLGRPVEEHQPVAIPGSELVTATGRLLHERAALERAAEALRDDLRRTLALRLGLPRSAPDDMLAAAVAARTAVSPGDLAGVLGPEPPADEAELIDLAAAVERIRAAAMAPPAAAKQTSTRR